MGPTYKNADEELGKTPSTPLTKKSKRIKWCARIWGRATYIQHMQKALNQMNLQLHNVISDITGDTGMNIIRAIIAGEYNPQVLATYRDKRCKSSIEIIAKSLTGN